MWEWAVEVVVVVFVAVVGGTCYGAVELLGEGRGEGDREVY